MNPKLKRAWSAGVAIAVAAATVPLLFASPASAAGIPSGTATLSPTAGGSATAFTLSLPAGAECLEDSAGGDWRVTSFMVPASVDPSTLAFDPSGPTPPGTGAAFRQPLWNVGGSPYVSKATQNADSPGGPGPILAPGSFDFSVYGPGDIPAGAYNIGIACTDETSAMQQFWSTTLTFTTAPGDSPAQVTWSVGAVPTAPTLTGVTPGNGTLTAAFTPVASTPATTSFTATATPTAGAPVTATGASSPITIPGLTNGTSYSVTVHATNTAGDSAESNAISATPSQAPWPAVGSLSAVPGPSGSGTADVTWVAPATGPAPSGYSVTVAPPAGVTVTHTGTDTFAGLSGLVENTEYTVTVTATYTDPQDVGTPASDTVAVLPSAVVMQHLDVTVPDGVLVLTQVCGTNALIPADTAGTTGFPNGSLPAVPADASGTAPTLTEGGSDPDPEFGEYPTPVPASYPTHCGVDLGSAELIMEGDGAGQYYTAAGVLNQVTVVDTRDTDTGWDVIGTMGDFQAGTLGTDPTFDGDQLGWEPFAQDTAAFTTPSGPYDQVVVPGPKVNPSTASGLGNGETLGSAASGSGRGIARLDARLKLLIPVSVFSGTYTGTLTITAS